MMSPEGSPVYGEFLDESDDFSPVTTPVNGTRRRPLQHQQREHQQQSSAFRKNGHHAQQQQQQYLRPTLVSQTRGGYGPVPHDDDDDEDGGGDSRRRTTRRILSRLFDVPRRLGCSADEMLRGEGEDGDYYRDTFNDASWSCHFGTSEEDGVWVNTTDQAGTIMATLVWFLISYSALTVYLLSAEGGVPPSWSMAYSTLCALALACHAKTSLTDPGSVPQSAIPQEDSRRVVAHHAMCSQCQTFKPPMSHHCRICNRCVARMDHHCPWMNNCVGAGNLKHFILFLVYTWLCCVLALSILGWSYFFCYGDNECRFDFVLKELVRVMLLLCLAAFMFTSSMLMNVCYGLMTGIGTIDRLKKKAQNTMSESDERPIPLRDVFGIAGYHTWFFPLDPVFEDYDVVMEFSTPQRLLREQMLRESKEQEEDAVSTVETDVFNV